MSKNRQTFVDPETGEVIESTWMARWWPALLCWGLGISIVVIGSIITGSRMPLYCFIPMGMVTLMALSQGMNYWRRDRLGRWIHDGIARHQHRRRQRILRSREDQAVPDGALSRAQPPGEPTPTDAALSLADEPDEPSHLPVSIEEDTQAVVDDKP